LRSCAGVNGVKRRRARPVNMRLREMVELLCEGGVISEVAPVNLATGRGRVVARVQPAALCADESGS
jgi:hypothetical protein